jgi:hypothetical protein
MAVLAMLANGSVLGRYGGGVTDDGGVTGAVVAALVGVAVGAILGFVLSQIESWLRRRRGARAAARLISMELMEFQVGLQTLEKRGEWVGPIPPRTVAWDSGRGALAEVASGFTLLKLTTVYAHLANLAAMIEDFGRKIPPSDARATFIKDGLEDIAAATALLDRHSGLAKERAPRQDRSGVPV